jgi:tetratricopeptide (TPR) repeat protein
MFTVGGQSTASPLDPVRKCLRTNDVHCAQEALSRIHDTQVRQSPDFLELEARVMGLQHEYAKAFELIGAALKSRPNEPRYLLVEGDLYQRSGDQKSAIRAFLQAEQLEPRSPVPLYSIGMSFFILGYYYNDTHLYDRAARHFQLAVRADSGYSKAQFMLGVLNAIQEKLPLAKLYFQKAIALDPQNPYYLLHYGVLLARLGQNTQALVEMQQAEKLDPNYGLAHFILGDLYSKLGRYEEARTELERATYLNRDLAAAYYRLGMVYRHLKMEKSAKKAFEKFRLTKEKEKNQDAVEQVISSPLLQEHLAQPARQREVNKEPPAK